MLLSIIIINYNTFRLTCDCIRSISQTAHLEYEIILVDNDSKECAAEKFLEVFPDIALIALRENVGFGRANNRGVEAAKGKYVLLLNSDTLVHEGTLDETVAYLEAQPEVDVLGCKVLFENNTVQTTVVQDEQEYRLLSALKYLIKRNSFFVETRLFLNNRNQHPATTAESQKCCTSTTPNEVDSHIVELNNYNGKRIGSLIGVFLLLKRSVYLASKGFDPDFFLYYEEIEWFVNRLRNYNKVYYPFVAIKHLHGGSDVHNTMNLQLFVSQHLFWYKMGYLQYLLYLMFTIIDIPSRLLVRLLYNRQRPSQDIPAILKSLPYCLNVLSYSNKYGARRQLLKLNYLARNKF